MKVLDLFSGIGGFAYGLHRAGFKTVAFCEIEKYCRKVLQKHYKGIKIYHDVKELEGKKIEEEHGTIDLIVGGFPCQPFSIAGARKGTNDNRHLWPEMFRLIKELKPRWIIGENVRGIVSIQDGMVFENVCTDLEGEGYEVRAFNIPAAGIGAPHKRERIWIVANSRRTLREGSKFQRTNANESKQEDANKFERSSSASKDNVADTESIESYVGKHRKHQTEGNGQSETRGKSSEDVADTNTRLSEQSNKEVQTRGNTLNSSSQHVANTNSQRQQEQCRSKSIQEKGDKLECSSSQEGHTGWEFEPDVGRVAHGVSGRVHRLRGLGNAIVPQIAEQIGKAIMQAEAEDIKYQGGGAYKAMLKLFRDNL